MKMTTHRRERKKERKKEKKKKRDLQLTGTSSKRKQFWNYFSFNNLYTSTFLVGFMANNKFRT